MPDYEPDLLLVYPQSAQADLPAIRYAVLGQSEQGNMVYFSGTFPANAISQQANWIQIYASTIKNYTIGITEVLKDGTTVSRSTTGSM